MSLSRSVFVGSAVAALFLSLSAPSVATAGEPGGPVRAGRYQCIGQQAGNMILIFKGNGQYANAQGVAGSYTQDGPLVTFRTGPWAGFYAYSFADGSVQLRSQPNNWGYMTCQLK
ncbi:MAG: hypothetical protein U1E50_08720 [Caulobacteraceae bacterium]